MDKSLLNRATNTDEAPTPGYLYGEICRMTQHSYETCQKTMEFLITRVKKKSPHTKFKALQVIKHVCREGRQDFRREMQKHVPVIKDCLQFRGEPDPLKGDEYFRRVRDAAKECLDAIFDNSVNPSSASTGMSSRIQGVGNPQAQVDPNASNSSTWTGRFGWGGNAAASQGPPPPQQPDSRYSAPTIGGQYPEPYAGSQPTTQQQPPPYNGPNAAAPYGGPSPYDHQGGANAGGYGGGANRMAGIGNPMYDNSKEEPKGFLAGLKEKAASKFSKNEGPRTNFAGPPPGASNPPEGWSFATNRGPTGGSYAAQQPGSYNPEERYNHPSSSSYNGPQEDPQAHLRDKGYSGARKKGGVGGSWGSASTARPRRSSKTSSSGDAEEAEQQRRESYSRAQQQPSQPMQQQQQLGTTAGASSDGTYERSLISGLCAPGGMRAVPPKDKLDLFIKNAATLDAELTGPIIVEEGLGSNNTWQVQSKALVTIETLIKTAGCEHFFDYFEENPEVIFECKTSGKAAVRDRATKILHILGVDGGTTVSTTTTSGGNGGQPDLLGGFSDAAPAAAPVPTEQSDNTAGANNLFDGLSSGGAAPAAPAAPSDMFGGLSLGGSNSNAAAAAPPVPTPAGAPVSASLIMDPLLEPVPPVNYQQQQQHSSSQPFAYNNGNGMMMMGNTTGSPMGMIGNVPMQGQGQPPPMFSRSNSQIMGSAMTPTGIAKTIQEPTAATSSGGSNTGFNFMNSGSGGGTTTSASSSSQKSNDSFSFIKDAMKNS